MSIHSVKAGTDLVSAPPPVRPAGNGPDFAALAASLARGDLAGARAAVGPTPPQARNDALHASVVDGNLAAARVMLGLEGGPAAAPHRPSGHERTAMPSEPAGTRDVNSAAADRIPGVATTTSTTATATASTPSKRDANIVDAGSMTADAEDVDVDAVLLALATGNAGNIPADVINRYGPGGALYDPAAIMDAYRASPLGHAQMAAMAWIGKPV